MNPNPTLTSIGLGRARPVPTVSILSTALLALLVGAVPAEAYIGPGAGFAFLGSFFALAWALVLGLATLALYPFRRIRRRLRQRGLAPDRPRRTIILGFDGMDPKLCERWIGEGKLPHLARLAERGSFLPLATTRPPLSPVAWSSFMTGVHPPRHGIFDFLGRDARTYLPRLSSSAIEAASRVLPIGKFAFPLGRPTVRSFRRSPPFWKTLGEHGVFSAVLRVPVTFPPESFDGVCLSGMSVPDLRGTQGSFTHFVEEGGAGAQTGGLVLPLRRDGESLRGTLPGPPDPIRPGATLELAVEITPGPGPDVWTVRIGDAQAELRVGVGTGWVALKFRAGPGFVASGIVRLRLTSTDPLGLYVSPIHIDPEKPALPISTPASYATYLAKKVGRFATLGLAEDTWALNERVLDEDGFLEQTWSIFEERERKLLDALEKTREGLVVCVFDATDRIQHMFYRYTDPDPRAACPGGEERYGRVIEDSYRRMDDLVGKVVHDVDDETLLFVVSDHGFASFRRGVNLNAWLRDEGWLVLREGASGEADYLRDVDWSKTRAYAVGLAGIFLNRQGREAEGIVPASEADARIAELAAKLRELCDPETGRPVVRVAVEPGSESTGPYLDQAPDLVVGWDDGYRVSWDAAVGKVAGAVVEDNPKSWSGDHCVDPDLVPGVLFSNRTIAADRASIVDVAPTVLTAYGVPVPRHVEGRALPMARRVTEEPASA